MCDKTDECFIHYRVDGDAFDAWGLRVKVTYVDEFAVFSEEVTREVTEADLDEAIMIHTQILMGVDVQGAILRSEVLRKRISPPVSIVVRVGHGALIDADIDGADRIDTLAPVGGQGINELHNLAVWAVKSGSYNGQD